MHTGRFQESRSVCFCRINRLERVKGIEPSYSAWKSRNAVVFSKAVLTFLSFLSRWDCYRISPCQNGALIAVGQTSQLLTQQPMRARQ